MEQEQSSGPQRGNDLELIELSVVLVADSNNPSIINPDFLKYNGIVDAGFEVQDFPISTPAFSRVAYKNGITVTSDPARVLFQQTRELTRANVVSPGIAKRYLQCIPHVPYRAIGINPHGFRRILGQEPNVIANMLREKGSWMSFQDVIPDVQLKAIYRYHGRVIFLDVINTHRTENDQKVPGVMFQANIHRDLAETNEPSRIRFLQSVLDSWESDLEDFRNLTGKFYEEK